MLYWGQMLVDKHSFLDYWPGTRSLLNHCGLVDTQSGCHSNQSMEAWLPGGWMFKNCFVAFVSLDILVQLQILYVTENDVKTLKHAWT